MTKSKLQQFIEQHKIHTMSDDDGYVAWYGTRSICKFIVSKKGSHDPCGYGSSRRSAISDLAKTHKLKGRENI
jgi:hypothetical protein